MCKQRTQTVCPCLLAFVPHCTHDSVHGRRRQAPQPPRADSQDLSPLPPQSHPLTPPNYTPAATACPRSQVTTAATAPPPPMRKEKRRRRHRPHLTLPIKACRHHSRRCSYSGRRPHPMRIVAKTTSVLLPDPHKTPPSPPPPPTLRWAHTRKVTVLDRERSAWRHCARGGGGRVHSQGLPPAWYIHTCSQPQCKRGGGGGKGARPQSQARRHAVKPPMSGDGGGPPASQKHNAPPRMTSSALRTRMHNKAHADAPPPSTSVVLVQAEAAAAQTPPGL